MEREDNRFMLNLQTRGRVMNRLHVSMAFVTVQASTEKTDFQL